LIAQDEARPAYPAALSPLIDNLNAICSAVVDSIYDTGVAVSDLCTIGMLTCARSGMKAHLEAAVLLKDASVAIGGQWATMMAAVLGLMSDTGQRGL
jgi:hypothetical protein